jgi:hypothetical protein
MSKDPVRGKTLRFTFDDGPMAGKAFEHVFDENGTVTFRAVNGDGGGGGGAKEKGKANPTPDTKYEVATVRSDVCAVSYLSSAGYTLTAVLDFATKKLVGFSSNEKMLALQHGSFEEVRGAADAKPKSGGAHPG